MQARTAILVVALIAAALIYTSVATAQRVYSPGPVGNWMCIHHYEGSWSDSGDPFWGGLQMNRAFMYTYGYDFIQRHRGGFANVWTPLEQMIAANRARVGVDWRGRYVGARGYYPWPNTARYCGLL